MRATEGTEDRGYTVDTEQSHCGEALRTKRRDTEESPRREALRTGTRTENRRGAEDSDSRGDQGEAWGEALKRGEPPRRSI